MQKIEVVKLFKHDGQTYYPGEVRMVSPQDAGYFCGVGWAKSAEHETGASEPSDVTLEVQNATHNVGVKIHG